MGARPKVQTDACLSFSDLSCTVSTGKLVHAQVIELTQEFAVQKIEAAWWKDLENPLPNVHLQPDYSWRWDGLVAAVHSDPYAAFVTDCTAIQTTDGAVQAAMICRIDGRSFLERDAGAVYVRFLATAPWNRGEVVRTPRYHREAVFLSGRFLPAASSGSKVVSPSSPFPAPSRFIGVSGSRRSRARRSSQDLSWSLP